jgi:PAS domain S-box-containing protein
MEENYLAASRARTTALTEQPQIMGVRAKSKADWVSYPPLLLRYGIAVASVTVVFGLHLLLDSLSMHYSFLLLILGATTLSASILVSAWYGGLGPGLLATALAALISDYHFVYPSHSFSGLSIEATPLLAFVLEGMFISSLAVALRFARSSVEERTWEARSLEKRYRAVVEQAAEGILIVDVSTKRVLDGNTAYQSLLGYSPEEMSYLTLYDLLPYSREDTDKYVGGVLDQNRYVSGEWRHRRKDGSLVDVEVSANMILDGGREAICMVVRDITERKRTEEVHRYHAYLLENVNDAILATDEQMLLTAWNKAAEKMYGWRADEVLGNHIWQVVPLEITEDQREDALRELAETGRFRIEVITYGKDGTPVYVEGVTVALRGEEGEITGYVNIRRDITERKRTENELHLLNQELAERGRELHRMVRRIVAVQEEERRRVAYEVHDGFTQTAAAAYRRLQTFAEHRRPESEEDREALEDAIALVRRTVEEARFVIANLRPTTLDDFGLATAIRMQIEELQTEGFEASYEETLGEERLPSTLEVNLFRLAQEALSNVRKHAETDRLRVAIGRHEEVVRLEVRDWGRGFRTSDVRGGAGPGETVGLSSMRDRVVLLSGSLQIRSEPGIGTSVVAEIPLPADGEEKEEADDEG